MKPHKVIYIPGMCNIGPAEIKLRKTAGFAGLILTAVFVIFFFVIKAPAAVWLTLFIPSSLAAIGYLQAWLHFCVNFGMRGLFNVGESTKSHETVEQKEFRAKDQKKAILLIVLSIAMGLVVAVIGYGLATALKF